MGDLIDLERQYRQRTAGLRTNILVAIGAAIFVDAANRLTGHEGAVHVMGYVVSSIGFLGAGVIMREEENVRGINTAATLWASGAVGACAGADLILEAAVAFPDYHFTIAGVPEWKKLDVKSNNVTILPPIPHNDLHRLFNEHEYYLQLSMAE